MPDFIFNHFWLCAGTYVIALLLYVAWMLDESDEDKKDSDDPLY